MDLGRQAITAIHGSIRLFQIAHQELLKRRKYFLPVLRMHQSILAGLLMPMAHLDKQFRPLTKGSIPMSNKLLILLYLLADLVTVCVLCILFNKLTYCFWLANQRIDNRIEYERGVYVYGFLFMSTVLVLFILIMKTYRAIIFAINDLHR